MPVSDKSPILVLGGDGYLGWPLSLALAKRNPTQSIILVDNFLRRRLVEQEGGGSLLPIGSPETRLQACRDIYGLTNLEFIQLDVNTPELDSLIAERRPAAVYHLAQQGSAPYSMRGPEQALFTLRNNEESNLRLLWAVKRYVPDCHVVKLGSFGEYATSGLDVAEGYFRPHYGDSLASRDVPYPRQADDFYHASKINDTNYISVACRNWGLRVTDIMQSTVFGAWTPDMSNHEALYTRLDYDECFGTVANRFLAQAVRNLPLTVYGTGHQRTGLMSLNDTVHSLSLMWDQAPESGTHRVINHLTEAAYSVNELADAIREAAAREGFTVEIAQGVYDPRGETDVSKLEYNVERRYIIENLQPASLQEMVSRTLRMIVPFRQRINVDLFAPRTLWNNSDEYGEDVIPLTPARRARGAATSPVNESAWDAFRRDHFPYRHINLNPGTLGSPSQDVLEAMQGFQAGETLAQPLEQYGRGRGAMKRITELVARMWPSDTHMPHVSVGASACANLLALSMARMAGCQGRRLRLLSTPHEHIGGLGAFEKIPEIEVVYLEERALHDAEAMEEAIARHRPDIGFFSHVAYDTGAIYPASLWAALLKNHAPHAWAMIDVSQSLGLLNLPFKHVDVLFGSCHKWLFGPRGTGLLWTNERFRQEVGGLNWSGESLMEGQHEAGFSLTGGMDFSTFAGLEAAVKLHRRFGGERIRTRSAALAAYLRPRLSTLLRRHGIDHAYLGASEGRVGETGVLTVIFPEFDPYPLYDAMNQLGVHVKCIKDRDKAGRPRQLLRFGCPYYENEQRLNEVLGVIENCLQAMFEQADRKPESGTVAS